MPQLLGALSLLACASALAPSRHARSTKPLSGQTDDPAALSRRAAASSLLAAVAAGASLAAPQLARAAPTNSGSGSASNAPALDFKTAGPPGFQYADVKLGTGAPPVKGQRVAVDYVMSTTGARYGSKIDSTVDRQTPYAWTLGDGSTIGGLELAVAGNAALGVPPMAPGGIRRVIIPSNAATNLAYAELAIPNKGSLQLQDCSTGRGPIPPNEPSKAGDMGAGEFQRFKNIYCNANRPYQPDLVLDVKLFGKK